MGESFGLLFPFLNQARFQVANPKQDLTGRERNVTDKNDVLM